MNTIDIQICENCGDEADGSHATPEQKPMVLCRRCWDELVTRCSSCGEPVLRTNVDDNEVCIWCKEYNTQEENETN